MGLRRCFTVSVRLPMSQFLIMSNLNTLHNQKNNNLTNLSGIRCVLLLILVLCFSTITMWGCANKTAGLLLIWHYTCRSSYTQAFLSNTEASVHFLKFSALHRHDVTRSLSLIDSLRFNDTIVHKTNVNVTLQYLNTVFKSASKE